jgi:hypothetical protein
MMAPSHERQSDAVALTRTEMWITVAIIAIEDGYARWRDGRKTLSRICGTPSGQLKNRRAF